MALASAVHQFFVAQARHLQEGRIDIAARVYSLPLIVALPNSDPGFVVMTSRAEIEAVLRITYESLQTAAIPTLRVAVLEARRHPGERTAASVVWYFLSADGSRMGRTQARYFLERRQGIYSIEMVEFERIAFPEIGMWIRSAGQPTTRLTGRQVH